MRAIYGAVAMQREQCLECNDMAFVVGGEMACCGAAPPGIGLKPARMSIATGIRTLPSLSERAAILSRQRDRCFYCGSSFGDVARAVGRKPRVLAPCWDHVEPFSWQSNNQAINFVAACSTCNGIKGARVFEKPEDAVAFVYRRRAKLGWATATELPPGDPLRALWRPVAHV